MALSQKMPQAPLQVVYLSRVRLNPYVRLLAEGVRQADPAIHTTQLPTLNWFSLLRKSPPDVIHLHWIELQYSYGHPPEQKATKTLHSLLRKLTLAQRRGARLVYTVHNISQHEGRYADLNAKANQWLFAHADAIHVHDEVTAQTVSEQYGRDENIYVIPHGNYIGVYPDVIGRAEARTKLRVPQDDYTYLCLGQLRPYKGLDWLIDAFFALDEPLSTLIVAGNADVPEYGAQLEALAESHPNIKLFSNYIADDELQTYFNASDACVLPYRRVTTSGAAMLAYSFGKPIVAPAIGPFPDLITPERGFLFHPDEDDLTDALCRIRNLDTVQARTAALDFAMTRDWTTLGAQHADIYRDLNGI